MLGCKVDKMGKGNEKNVHPPEEVWCIAALQHLAPNGSYHALVCGLSPGLMDKPPGVHASASGEV